MQEFVFCIQVGVKVVNDVWRAVFLCREGVEVFPALNEFCRGDCTRCCGLWNIVLRGEGNVFSYLLHFCAFQWLGWVLLGLDSDTMALGRVSKLTVLEKRETGYQYPSVPLLFHPISRLNQKSHCKRIIKLKKDMPLKATCIKNTKK